MLRSARQTSAERDIGPLFNQLYIHCADFCEAKSMSWWLNIWIFKIESSVGESAAKIVNTLLTKIRLQREDDQVDVALYVPILKILMLYPDKLKYNISTILVQTSVSQSSFFGIKVESFKVQN